MNVQQLRNDLAEAGFDARILGNSVVVQQLDSAITYQVFGDDDVAEHCLYQNGLMVDWNVVDIIRRHVSPAPSRDAVRRAFMHIVSSSRLTEDVATTADKLLAAISPPADLRERIVQAVHDAGVWDADCIADAVLAVIPELR